MTLLRMMRERELQHTKALEPKHRRLVADALRKAIVGSWYHHDQEKHGLGSHFMCIVLGRMVQKGVIPPEQGERARKFVVRLIKPRNTLLVYLCKQKDPEYQDLITDGSAFGIHIYHCRYYWQLIRLLEA